jgi:hypothetical protein
MLKKLLFVMTFSVATAVHASEYDRILIPALFGAPVDGAHGSQWLAELWVFNPASSPATLHWGNPSCSILCPGSVVVPPGVARRIDSYLEAHPDPRAIIYHVHLREAPSLSFSLRVRDLSRLHETGGTEIPVVREHQLRRGSVHLLNIPLDSDFRATVRVLVPGAEHPQPVLVRVRSQLGGSLLAEYEAQAVPLDGSAASPFPWTAALLELPLDLTQWESAAARIEISVPGGRHYWAYASIIHNETQHMTVVSPQ